MKNLTDGFMNVTNTKEIDRETIDFLQYIEIDVTEVNCTVNCTVSTVFQVHSVIILAFYCHLKNFPWKWISKIANICLSKIVFMSTSTWCRNDN